MSSRVNILCDRTGVIHGATQSDEDAQACFERLTSEPEKLWRPGFIGVEIERLGNCYGLIVRRWKPANHTVYGACDGFGAWQVGISRGLLVVSKITPNDSIRVGPRTPFLIPLDQVAGEAALIAFHASLDVPRWVKSRVEQLHSENRRLNLEHVT